MGCFSSSNTTKAMSIAGHYRADMEEPPKTIPEFPYEARLEPVNV